MINLMKGIAYTKQKIVTKDIDN